MALKKFTQLLVREEAHPGTYVSPLTATYGKYLPIDPTFDPNVDFEPRDIARNTFSAPPALAGLRTGIVKFKLEMAGHAHATPDVPIYDLLLRACGFKSVSASYITTTAAGVVSGPLRHGETITQATTAATAVVIRDQYGSGAAQTVYVWNTTGSPNNSAVWTGGTSGATFTPNLVPTDAGQAWFPIGPKTSKCAYASNSGTLVVGDVLKGTVSGARALLVQKTGTSSGTIWFRYGAGSVAFTTADTITDAAGTDNVGTITSIVQDDVPSVTMGVISDTVMELMIGARGTVTFTKRVGKPVLMEFEFMGKMLPAESIADQAYVTGVAHEMKVPPVFVSASLTLGHEGDASTALEYSPRLDGVTLSLGNRMHLRENVSNSYGLDDCEITGRASSGSFSPELDFETSYAFLGDFANGTVARMDYRVGTAAGNKFLFHVPGMVYRGMGKGERDGVLTRTATFDCGAGYYSTETTQAFGTDNEIVIIYGITSQN